LVLNLFTGVLPVPVGGAQAYDELETNFGLYTKFKQQIRLTKNLDSGG